MDQMPLHFSYHSSHMLEKRGIKTINVHKSSSQTKRATAALTVTAAGDFLTPMIIFKGKPNGLIARRELPTLDPTSIYACQDQAWMDDGGHDNGSDGDDGGDDDGYTSADDSLFDSDNEEGEESEDDEDSDVEDDNDD